MAKAYYSIVSIYRNSCPRFECIIEYDDDTKTLVENLSLYMYQSSIQLSNNQIVVDESTSQFNNT